MEQVNPPVARTRDADPEREAVNRQVRDRRRATRLLRGAVGLALVIVGVARTVHEGDSSGAPPLLVGLGGLWAAFRDSRPPPPPEPMASLLSDELAAAIREHRSEHGLAATAKWVSDTRGVTLEDAARMVDAAEGAAAERSARPDRPAPASALTEP